MEALAARDAGVPEVLVLVLERDVVIEPQRSQVGEVLDFVRRVDARRDQRQRHDERGDQHRQLPPHAQLAHAQPAPASSPKAITSIRLNEAWLTIGAIDAAARQVDEAPQRPQARR